LAKSDSRQIILATIVLVLTAALAYTLLPQGQKQELKSWWSMPHHITIPILSPFASVVCQLLFRDTMA
jgi:hypothetical protein